MKAAEHNNMPLCMKLLEAGANPFIKNNNGSMADSYAFRNSCTELYEMLKQYMQVAQAAQQ